MRSGGVKFEERVHSKMLLKRCLSQVIEFVLQLHYPNYQHFQGKTVGMTRRPLIVGCGDWRSMLSWNNEWSDRENLL